MKKALNILIIVFLILMVIGCSKPNNDNPTKVEGQLNEVNYSYDQNKNYTNTTLINDLSGFSSLMYDITHSDEDNYVMSPLSIYMAFSLLYFLSEDDIKEDICLAFNLSKADMEEAGNLFLKLVTKTIDEDNNIVSMLDLNNSIWLDNSVNANQEILDNLAKALYCYAYRTPFSEDNALANATIRKFIKEKTYGLIDREFDLDENTIFALINTLYFKDGWFDYNPLDIVAYNFISDNGKELKPFLLGQYVNGMKAENSLCEFFYTQTNLGYKIKFIVPKDGVSLDSVLTQENIQEINEYNKYITQDDNIIHMTRTIFPAFKVNSFTDLKEIFLKNNILPSIFTSFYNELTSSYLYISDIKHQAVVDVNKDGVEAAAVTIIATEKSAYKDPTYKYEYHDFFVDKGFGFIITTEDDLPLFIGKITNPLSSYEVDNLPLWE